MHKFSNLLCVRKLMLAVLTLFLSHPLVKAESVFTVPDFAYPADVIESADSLLKVSLERHNGTESLRNVLNLCIARNIMDNSDASSFDVNLIDSILPKLEKPYRNLAWLLEADILRLSYQADKNNYDSRELPLVTPFPEDPAEWNSDMYKTRILELVDSATLSLDRFTDISVNVIDTLIDIPAKENVWNLSISDFIALKAVRILKEISTGNGITEIPFYNSSSQKTLDKCIEDKARSLLAEMMKWSEDSISEGFAMIEFSSILSQKDAAEYLWTKSGNFEGDKEAILLRALWQNPFRNDIASDKQFYERIENWVRKNPGSYFESSLEYILTSMGIKKMTVSVPSLVFPESNITGSINFSNINKGYVLIFKVNKNQSDLHDALILKKFFPGTPIQTIEVNSEGEIPFETSKEFEISGLSPGLYVAIPSETKRLPSGWNRNFLNSSYSTFRVSEISIITSYDGNEKNSGRIYVVDAKNQNPIKGALVKVYENRKKTPKKTASTGIDGSISVPNGYFRIEAEWKSNFARYETGFSFYPTEDRPIPYASILTDLSLYHPEDTVRFSAVGWLQSKNQNSLIRDSVIDITLRDPNFKVVDKKTLSLDSLGRVSSEFKIPGGVLLGTYRLMASYPSFPGMGSGAANIEVADYKLPPFNVILEKKASENNEIFISGSAITFSGMPVTNASVSVTVRYLPWFGMRNTFSEADFTTSTTTKNDGSFEIILPTSGLKGTRFEEGKYSVTALVTSDSGESQESSPLFFSLGKTVVLRPNIDSKTLISSDTLKLFVPAYDIMGMPEKTSVSYCFTNIDKPEISIHGEFITPNLIINAGQIVSGKYRLDFNLGDQSIETVETVFYRNIDDNTPYKTPLWIPDPEYYYTKGTQELEIKFGSYWPGSHVLCIVSDERGIVNRDWIKTDSCLNKVKITIPDKDATLFVDFAAMHDFDAKTGRITIRPKSSLDKMKIETLSFREKISAGNHEKWRFKFTVEDQDCRNIPVFAVMTDKALNAVKRFQWNMNIWSPSIYSKTHIGTPYFGFANSYRSFSKPDGEFKNFSYMPDWDTYGYPLIAGSWRINGPVLYKMAKVTDAETPMMANIAYSRSAGSADMIEEAEDSIEEITSEQIPSDTEQLRPIEMPVAFFKPDLTTDEEGVMNLDFIVPDFNTTWQLQVAAYDNRLLNAVIELDALASKPVMVKTNLPQFLNTGDFAEISATLFNNSPDVASIGGRLVIIDPITDSILSSVDFNPELVEPSGNRVVSINFPVATNTNVLCVRAYAIGDNHSDGEEGIIPVFPSFTPVIEAETFFLNADQESFKLNLPSFRPSDNVTLKYCDNPLWDVLLSLPMVLNVNDKSALSLSQNLYGMIIGRDLVSAQPALYSGLMEIFASEDSTLTQSKLQTEEYLKNVELVATPWVNNAESQTERIRSLKSLLDDTQVNAQIANSILQLKKLQKSDGGWSWFDGMGSSPYITSRVLGILGWLKSHDLLNRELTEMADRGIKFYDKWLIKQKREKILPSSISIMNYLYHRLPFKVKMSDEMKLIEKETIEILVKEWRHWNLSQKAMASILLWNSGTKFQEEARMIGMSLLQFTNRQRSMEDLAMMLEAFSCMDGFNEGVDKTRELLFLKKETLDWGNNPDNAGMIHSLLTGLQIDEISCNEPEIWIDGNKLDLSESGKLTGNYTISLSPEKVSKKTLFIKRQEGIVAWGGVITQRVLPVREIKAASVKDIAVIKNIYLYDANGKTKNISKLHKGDKVIISLEITCGKDMEYVSIVDRRSACLNPLEWVSQMVFVDGMAAYREIRKGKTSFFIENMPAGKHIISYECTVDRDGEYSLGIVNIQSLYSPIETAHSAGKILKISQD